MLKGECRERLATKLHEGEPVWPGSKIHGVGMKMEWSAKTGHEGHMNQNDDFQSEAWAGWMSGRRRDGDFSHFDAWE